MTHLTQAKKIAQHIVSVLKPHCKVIDIAGSVSRGKLEVKDIEVCCVPKMKTIDSNTLFDVGEVKVVVHPDFVTAVRSLGKALKGKPDGRYMQIGTNAKINLDLFMPEEIDYYRQLAIRIGPSDYSHKVIAGGWRKMGWCGTRDGLRMTNDCKLVPNPHDQAAPGKWECIKDNPHLPPVWKSEREFFQWLNVVYKEPGKRSV